MKLWFRAGLFLSQWFDGNNHEPCDSEPTGPSVVKKLQIENFDYLVLRLAELGLLGGFEIFLINQDDPSVLPAGENVFVVPTTKL